MCTTPTVAILTIVVIARDLIKKNDFRQTTYIKEEDDDFLGEILENLKNGQKTIESVE